jgi:hypothetical protein
MSNKAGMLSLKRYPRAVHTRVATPNKGIIPTIKPRATVKASFPGDNPMVSKPNSGLTSLRFRYVFDLWKYKVWSEF